MPAIGLTTKTQAEPNSRFLAAKVYLGKRQERVQRFDANGNPKLDSKGKPIWVDQLAKNADLKTQFRIQALSDQARKILSQAYRVAPDRNGDLLVESLNIVPIAHDVDRTFDVWFKSYQAKNPLFICDRQRIKKEWTEAPDRWGHVRGRLADCDKPCPMADEPSPFVSCPNGCAPSGVLHFYIQELIEARIELPCQLTVVGKTNFQGGGLYDQWSAIASRYSDTIGQGFWSQAIPFPCGSYILCKLSRIELDILRPQLDTKDKVTRMVNGKPVTEGRRTGEKAKGKAYPLLLSVDPLWEATYYAWRRQVEAITQAKELKQLGFNPSPKLLEQAQIIDVEIVNRAFLPPGETIDPPITEEELAQLRAIAKETWVSVWEKNSEKFLNAVDSAFGTKDLKELRRSQLEEAKSLLKFGEF